MPDKDINFSVSADDVIHFCGIGGVGMCALAEVCYRRGYNVQGSDTHLGKATARLAEVGVRILDCQSADNISDVDIVVVSSAIPHDNVELCRAKELNKLVIHRSQLLSWVTRNSKCIAVSGTHGKTTTTSLIAHLLEQADRNPTTINGGLVLGYGSHVRCGDDEWCVVEADESDRSFLSLNPMFPVVTNIDEEHMENYGNIENLYNAFSSFIQNRSVPEGRSICCIDSKPVAELLSNISEDLVITYGLSNNANVYATDIRYLKDHTIFTVIYKIGDHLGCIPGVILPLLGAHNVQNCLAAISIAICTGVEENIIHSAFTEFQGVDRRFTTVGKWKEYYIIDDYSHHPVEVSAALSSARLKTNGKVILVHQPHRYTRLKSCFKGFVQSLYDADAVIILDVYPAGENPILGISSKELYNALVDRGHSHAYYVQDHMTLPDCIMNLTTDDDHGVIIMMGAGNITHIARNLEGMLTERQKA